MYVLQTLLGHFFQILVASSEYMNYDQNHFGSSPNLIIHLIYILYALLSTGHLFSDDIVSYHPKKFETKFYSAVILRSFKILRMTTFSENK